MTHEDIRKALLEECLGPKEVRTNDGRAYRVEGVERWALVGNRLVVVEGPEGRMEILSIRNISSISVPPGRAPESRSA